LGSNVETDAYYDCQWPYYEALLAVAGVVPPGFLCKPEIYSLGDLTDDELDELQSWCVSNANPGWSTGIGMMEAAEILVVEAVANGNIEPPKEKPRYAEERKSQTGPADQNGTHVATPVVATVINTTRRRLVGRHRRENDV
jgi:hypothetical protein